VAGDATSAATPARRLGGSVDAGAGYRPSVTTRLRVGLGLAALSVVLFLVAVAGIAPFISGGAPGECWEDGPHAVFLILWPASALLAVASAIHLSTGYRQPKGPAIRRAAFWVAVFVPLGVVALLLVVVADGISECGF
jgi:hypothetical protein